MSKQEQKIKKEFRENCQKELRYVSGIFMSQGDTPTEKLNEAADRFELYLFKALANQRKEILQIVLEDVPHKYQNRLIKKLI